MPTFEIEDSYNLQFIAGIDEAGRGPLCGPVFSSCALIADRKVCPIEIDDSKKITEKNRERIFEEILKLEEKRQILFGIGEGSIEEIEKFNIRNATKISMKRAYENLIEKYSLNIDMVIVDGNFIPDISTKAEFIIKGDEKSISIATASIIAKVSRDRLLRNMDLEFPEYCWAKNKGYGTAEHIKAIKKYGISKYHRKSFLQNILKLF
ncbi:MAG: ribonuclease HII [Rickettsiales bacterium]|nr:ribonuclease HII [Rickettsiales bacterium]